MQTETSAPLSERIVALYKSGLTVKDIVDKGVASQTTVLNYLTRAGLHTRRERKEVDTAMIHALKKQGMTTLLIAQRLGVSAATVNLHLNKEVGVSDEALAVQKKALLEQLANLEKMEEARAVRVETDGDCLEVFGFADPGCSIITTKENVRRFLRGEGALKLRTAVGYIPPSALEGK